MSSSSGAPSGPSKPSIAPHPSLPARPTTNIPPNSKPPNSSASAFVGFKPRSIQTSTYTSRWPSQPSAYASAPVPPAGAAPLQTAGYGAGYGSYGTGQAGGYYQQLSYGNQPSSGQDPYTSQTSPPNITNPFPAPSAGGGRYATNADYDPEQEAAIAQWQSAYMAKDDPNNVASAPRTGGFTKFGNNGTGTAAGPRGNAPIDVASNIVPDSGVAAVVSGGADGKQKTVVRSGGGKVWQDSTLLEWDPAHPRLFIGNLAGEVTDESLKKAFARYPSVAKARVVRDKRTTKSKGFGFVSFANSDDYFQAAKEMQGKYIGSHPVLIKRSTTEIKATTPAQKGGKHGKGGGGGGGGAQHAGVQKKASKKKGGLRVLG